MGLVSGNISRQAAGAEKSVSGLNNSLSKTSKTAAIANKAMIGFGLAAAAAFAVGLKGAADLQNAIAQTAVAMGRSTQWVDSNFTGVAMNMSAVTAQSLTQSMELLRTMATSGLSDPSQLKAMSMPIAQYADTQFLGKNATPFNTSAALAAKIAHEFGARTAQEIYPILNSLQKIGNDMPDSLSAMATQLKYYAPKFAEKGVSANEILMLSATADRMGYGTGKSGTGFLQIYRNLLHPTTPAMGGAQDLLGISGFIHKDGTFDPEGLFNKLHADSAAYTKRGEGKTFDELLNAAFTSNAGLIAGVMASNAGRLQYDNVRKTMGRVKDMNVVQPQLMDTFAHQIVQLTTNFQSLVTLIAKPWLRPFTDAIHQAAVAVGSWAKFMLDHQDVAKVVGGGMMAAGAAGIIGLVSMGANFLHVFATLGKGGLHAGGGFGHLFGKGAGAAAEVAEGAAEATAWKSFGLTGLISKIAPALGWMIKLGVKIVPVVSELALLYTALYALVGAFAWLNNVLGIHKQANTPSTHAERAAGAAAFHGSARNVSTGAAHTGAGGADHAAGAAAFKGMSVGGHGRGTSVTVSFNYHAPSGGDDASHRRAFVVGARKAAEQVAEVMSNVARTSGRAAGALPAMSGASHYEFAGSPG